MGCFPLLKNISLLEKSISKTWHNECLHNKMWLFQLHRWPMVTEWNGKFIYPLWVWGLKTISYWRKYDKDSYKKRTLLLLAWRFKHKPITKHPTPDKSSPATKVLTAIPLMARGEAANEHDSQSWISCSQCSPKRIETLDDQSNSYNCMHCVCIYTCVVLFTHTQVAITIGHTVAMRSTEWGLTCSSLISGSRWGCGQICRWTL